MGSEKKSGGGLDDLKARLGLDSVLSKSKKEPPKPAAPSEAGPAPSAPGAQAGPGGAPGAGAPGAAAESVPVAEAPPDYATRVSQLEEPVAGEGEPDPVLSGSHQLIDLNLAVPVGRGVRIALIVIVIVAVAVALGAGFGFGRVMRDREVADEVQVTSGQVATQVEQVGQRLSEFQQALAGYPNDYSPELNQVLTSTYQGGGPVLSSRALSDARILMTTGEDLTRDLINYSLSTQILQAMVQEHLGKTVRDRRLIEGLVQAQGERPTNYGVVFSWDDASQRFREFYDGRQAAIEGGEDPNAITFIPSRGVVATFDTLDMQVQGEDGENPIYQYPVLIGGQREMVAVYNLIVVDADQFVSNPNEETALTRYAGRVGQIRSHLENLLATQEMLLEELHNRAGDTGDTGGES